VAAPVAVAGAEGGMTATDIANQRMDEVARTIYVGNVNTALTDEHLKEFFGSCGPVVITKLAGEADGTRPTRFAFVEFQEIEAAQKALGVAGTTLAGFPLKIRKANNAILKPLVGQPAPKKDLEAIMAKVKAATQKITKKAERSRSRSRDRDRSRRSRRSRSRDRDRSRRSRRSRSRDRDKSRRGRDDDRGSRYDRGNDVRCYNCGERGHISRNCTKSRSRSPPKKKPADEHAGMFFNGYKWEPIEGAAATPDTGAPPGQAPMGTVRAILEQQAVMFQQRQQ